MKLENQVCKLEQARRLKELGIVQESEYKRVKVNGKEPFFQIFHISEHECHIPSFEKYSAFTVAELGVMLHPCSYIPNYHDFTKKWYLSIDRNMGFFYNTEAEARAASLILLVADGVITPEECNKRLQEA